MKISACLIVKNEQKYLQRCLESIYQYVDEIIITDTGSTDMTVEIAKKYTDKIFFFDWIDDFSAARNFCQSHARGEYILRIDADEYFHQKDIMRLIEEIHKRKNVDTFDVIMNYHNSKSQIHANYTCCVAFKKSIQWKWKVHEVLDIHQNHVSDFLPQVIIQHTSINDNKSWKDEHKLLQWFEDNPENLTVFELLVNHYIFHNQPQKIQFLLDMLGDIDYFYIKKIISIRKKLLLFENIDIKILDKKIKKSILIHKK